MSESVKITTLEQLKVALESAKAYIDGKIDDLGTLACKSEVAYDDLANALKDLIDGKAKQTSIDMLTGEDIGKSIRTISSEEANKVIEATVHPNVLFTVSSPLEVNTIYSLGLCSGDTVELVLPKGNIGDCIQVDFVCEPYLDPATLIVSSPYGMTDLSLIPEKDRAYSILFDWGLIGYENVKYGITHGWRISYAAYDGADTNYTDNDGSGL